MAIDLGRLESELLGMSAEGAPGREFCEAISELAATGRFVRLRDVLPGIVYDELWERYRRSVRICGRLADAGSGDAAGLCEPCAAEAHVPYPAAVCSEMPATLRRGRDSAGP